MTWDIGKCGMNQTSDMEKNMGNLCEMGQRKMRCGYHKGQGKQWCGCDMGHVKMQSGCDIRQSKRWCGCDVGHERYVAWMYHQTQETWCGCDMEQGKYNLVATWDI